MMDNDGRGQVLDHTRTLTGKAQPIAVADEHKVVAADIDCRWQSGFQSVFSHG